MFSEDDLRDADDAPQRDAGAEQETEITLAAKALADKMLAAAAAASWRL